MGESKAPPVVYLGIYTCNYVDKTPEHILDTVHVYMCVHTYLHNSIRLFSAAMEANGIQVNTGKLLHYAELLKVYTNQ